MVQNGADINREYDIDTHVAESYAVWEPIGHGCWYLTTRVICCACMTPPPCVTPLGRPKRPCAKSEEATHMIYLRGGLKTEGNTNQPVIGIPMVERQTP